MKPMFIPKNFDGKGLTSRLDCELASEVANQIFAKLIESWEVVYGSKIPATGLMQWDPQPSMGDTHQARLAFIEEIPKQPCKHLPDSKEGLIRGPGLMVFSAKCKHCGVELVADWRAK